MASPADPYVLTEKLGEGSFAIVYRATRVGDPSKTQVAVKRFKVGLTPKQAADVHKASLEESALLDVLHLEGAPHPNIVQLVEFYTDKEGHACMVMTLAEGGSAKARMEGVWGHAHNAASDAPLKLFTATETTVYASHIISAIDFTHSRNVVHRDVKPGNIVFSADDVPMLADFGSAKIIDEVRASVGGSVAGTTEYMSPEVLAREPATTASDIWSFGATLLCFLTGHELAKKPAVSTLLARTYNKRPGAAWTLDAHIASELDKEQKAVWARAPEELRRVITACLQVDEAARPSAAALKADPLFVRARELEELVRPWKAQVTVLKIERDKINFELAEEREAHEKDTSALALARTRVKELEAAAGAGRPEKRVLEGHTDYVLGVAALADGRVVSASLDHTLIVWRL